MSLGRFAVVPLLAVAGMSLSACVFSLGGDELAFASGFEDGGAVAFEVGLHAPQARDSGL